MSTSALNGVDSRLRTLEFIRVIHELSPIRVRYYSSLSRNETDKFQFSVVSSESFRHFGQIIPIAQLKPNNN